MIVTRPMVQSLRAARSVVLLAGLCVSCGELEARGCKVPGTKVTEAPSTPEAPGSAAAQASSAAAPVAAAAPGSSVVGPAGIAAWDALSAADKARLKANTTIYLHQSVGQDLEDGAEEAGWKFAYYGRNADAVEPGLNGGLFNDVGPIDNGKPMEKLALVNKVARRHAGKVKVMAFSFGYADVRNEDLAQVQAEYLRVAKEVRATGARMLHVTPPLVFDVAENSAKMKMRTWMLGALAGEVIFDLQDIESLDGGKRCEVGGVWRICQVNRSTSACPSKGQGIDGDGQGHLCSKKGALFAKALLYAISRAAL